MLPFVWGLQQARKLSSFCDFLIEHCDFIAFFSFLTHATLKKILDVLNKEYYDLFVSKDH